MIWKRKPRKKRWVLRIYIEGDDYPYKIYSSKKSELVEMIKKMTDKVGLIAISDHVVVDSRKVFFAEIRRA